MVRSVAAPGSAGGAGARVRARSHRGKTLRGSTVAGFCRDPGQTVCGSGETAGTARRSAVAVQPRQRAGPQRPAAPGARCLRRRPETGAAGLAAGARCQEQPRSRRQATRAAAAGQQEPAGQDTGERAAIGPGRAIATAVRNRLLPKIPAAVVAVRRLRTAVPSGEGAGARRRPGCPDAGQRIVSPRREHRPKAAARSRRPLPKRPARRSRPNAMPPRRSSQSRNRKTVSQALARPPAATRRIILCWRRAHRMRECRRSRHPNRPWRSISGCVGSRMIQAGSCAGNFSSST